MRKTWSDAPLHLVRGSLIGTAEVIPGVSGGTVALVTGVYDALIGSADHLVSAARMLATDLPGGRGLARAKEQLRQVSWSVVLPVGVGMVVAFVVGARLLEPVLTHHPVSSRAVFAGLILASILVPLRAIGGTLRVAEVLLLLAAALAAATLTGFPPATAVDPPLPVVALAAACAVCVLVLPGVSGSFLLLTVGLYQPTIAAVNDRDATYLLVFALGAVVGLSLFVKGLQWLLTHRRRLTLAVMTGLMAGSLRALWPWQGDDRQLQAPGGDVVPIVALTAAGVAVVLILIAAEHWMRSGRASGNEPSPTSVSVHTEDG